MSDRGHWAKVRSSVKPGDVITGCRDNDTRSYRLFTNKGWRDLEIGQHVDECMCCDLSIDDIRKLAAILESAIEHHESWPPPEEEWT